MKRILVLGGTGFVGRHVCEKAVRQGWCVTVPTRRRVNASAIQSLPGVEPIEANVHDEASLVRLAAGHDAVVNLVAILHGDEATFKRAHVDLPQHIAHACRAAGVKRLVHVSALGAATDAPSMYLRSKARGEQVLQAAGLSLSLLRPSVIFGAGDRFLNLFAQMQGWLPLVPLAGSDARFQPVWVEDVAQAIVTLLRRPEHDATVHEACGPDVLTLREIVQFAGRAVGRARPVVALPDALARLQATLMELAPGEPLMSRDNLDSMKIDNIASGQHPGLATLGITASALAAVAPTYLGARGDRSKLTELRRTAGRF